MARAAEAVKQDGGTVVLTNGCFDILHMGHLDYLEAARSLGSVLFVGVNADESVRRLKGPHRPFTRQADRATLVAALRTVDLVTIFREDTATELVKAVRPDVYVKGGDYSENPSSGDWPGGR
ncbi:MAG TPA: adenylyltransferase/cytidyltransferase family protein, partial [Chloroflexota bacterium]|nr:adenylyltransferase/cytidyltransferase family protein [Chloroflexota bacterium]